MELLSSEERNALRVPFGEGGLAHVEAETRSGEGRLGWSGGPPAERAVFPSVAQLDPERTAALAAAVLRWLEAVNRDLSRVIRAACDLWPPRQQSLPRAALPPSDETPFWARVDGHPGHYLLLSLPRPFAATICERIFGAPLVLRDDRALTAGEVALLTSLAKGWIGELAQIWPAFRFLPCDPPEQRGAIGGGGSPGDADGRRSGDGVKGCSSGEARAGSWLRLLSTLCSGSVEGSIRVTLAPATARLLLGETGGMGPDPSSPADVNTRLGEVPLQVRAILGETQIRLDELSRLKAGDVIALKRNTRDPLDVYVADRRVFRCRAGLSGQQVAVELLSQSDEEACR
jgi:hypothetical protein